MKRFLLASTISAPILFGILASCASDSLPPSGSGTSGAGGASTTGGGPTTTTGSTGGATGVTTTGTGTTGAATTTAATTSTTSAGGSAGSTTSAGGSAGAGTAGSGGSTGGTDTGAGGSGGAKSDAGATGGTGGAGGSGGACDLDCLAGTQKSNYGFVWKDSWFITGCYVKDMADCYSLPATCPPAPAGGGFEDSGSVARETFPLGGTAGQTYVVTFTINGLSEAKVYTGGKWADPAIVATTPIAGMPTVSEGGTNANIFYIGGTAVPSTYNVMRIRVLSPTKTEVARYYMNAFPNATWESHRVFALSYTHSFEVPGGGFIEYNTEDSNCRAIDNCGPGTVPNDTCPAARYIPNEPMTLQLPATYGFIPTNAGQLTTNVRPLGTMNVVNQAAQPWHAQLNHFKVTSVVLK